MQIPIPSPDPMPLPAPVWLFRSLLLLTFFLHLVVMNFAFGSSVIALISARRGRQDEYAARLSRQLRSMLPVLVAFTITLGVAALLFVQVLYGQLLYSSSVLLGTPWMAVIPLLIVGYYAFYWSSMRESQAGAWIGCVILLVIGFAFTNNMTLMLTPERWLAFYRVSTAGFHYNFGDTTVVPRYLHMVLGATALGGLWLVILGVREQESGYKQWLARNGGICFSGATILNVMVGFWFLFALPKNVLKVFMGGSGVAAAILGFSVIAAIGAMVHLMLAVNSKKGSRPAVIGIACGILAVALMVLVRDFARAAYLAPYFRPTDLQVAPQWGVIALFLVLFAGGLVTLGWMIGKLVGAGRRTMVSGASGS